MYEIASCVCLVPLRRASSFLWAVVVYDCVYLSHRYELSYEGERTTCNGATTATSSFPPGSSGTDKGKEKWGSTERALAVCEKDAGLHTSNGEKAHGNHPSNGQAGGHHGQTGVHHNGEVHECYRWSRCKRPLSLSSMRDKGVPLPAECVEVGVISRPVLVDRSL